MQGTSAHASVFFGQRFVNGSNAQQRPSNVVHGPLVGGAHRSHIRTRGWADFQTDGSVCALARVLSGLSVGAFGVLVAVPASAAAPSAAPSAALVPVLVPVSVPVLVPVPVPGSTCAVRFAANSTTLAWATSSPQTQWAATSTREMSEFFPAIEKYM